jgi:hypothetical protein
MAGLSDILNKQPKGANKGAQNFITIAPGLADVNIGTSYQSLSAGTNYFETILQPNGEVNVSDVEIRTAIAYRDAFRRGDVVTALSDFNNYAVKKYFADDNFSFDSILYWYQKLKFANKELISLNSPGSTFYDRILPNLNPAVSKDLTSSFKAGHELQQSFFQTGINTSISGLLNKAQAAAQSLGNTVQSAIGDIGSALGLKTPSTLADAGVPNQSFLENVSDSIGTLTNSKYLQLDSTLPIFDITQNYYGVPIPYSVSTDSKISNNTRNISYNLSLNCTALFRRNLIGVAYTQPAVASNMASDATVAHGLNLINDLPTFVQLNQAVPKLVQTLQSVFTVERVFLFIKYLSNVGNKSAMNLRDIFPVTPADKDFTVVTSADRALASEQEIKSISDDAIVQSYAEQQGINYANNSFGSGSAIIGPGSGGSTVTAAGGNPASSGANPAAVAAAKTQSQQLNQQMDASGKTIATFTGKNGKEYMDQSSFLDYTTQRLQNSPLLTTPIPDAANYPVLAGHVDANGCVSDPAVWAKFMWQTTQCETGGGVVQYETGPNDPGGSFGAFSVSPAQAKSLAGYNVTPDQLQNPNLNTNVGVSLVENEIVKSGKVGGLYVRNGGAFAGLTMNKLQGKVAI